MERIVILRAWGSLLLIFMMGFAIASHSQKKALAEDEFPLDRGTYWIYRGTDYWTSRGAQYPDATKKVTWRTEVTNVIVHRKGTLVAFVKGFPLTVDRADGQQPREDLVIKSSDGKFFLIPHGDIDLPDRDTRKRVKDPDDSLEGLLTDNNWFFQLPLSQGKKFCEQEHMKRSDDWYCWVTGASHWVRLGQVRGVDAARKQAFSLEFRTFPDDMDLEFVPGVGITKYEYHHHGYLYGTELKLTEFHSGKHPQD